MLGLGSSPTVSRPTIVIDLYRTLKGINKQINNTNLCNLRAFIFAINVDKAPTKKSKISTLLRAVRKLGSNYVI